MDGGASPLRLERALLALDRVAARAIVMEAAGAIGALRTAEGIVVPALERIGAGWDEGTVALSQVYMAGRICEDLVAGLAPAPDTAPLSGPRLAIVTLRDHHLLGKRLVLSVLRSSGLAVLDYGNAGAEEAAARATADRIEVLFVSVLMLASALQVAQLRARLDGLGAKGVRIAVGGAPFRLEPELHREVGADAVGRTASDAVELAWALSPGASS